MTLPIVIIGAGGHGKVVSDALTRAGREIRGFVDPNPQDFSKLGYPILGDDDVLKEFRHDEIALANGIGSVSDTGPRREIFESLKQQGFTFVDVVHPDTVVAVDTEIGEGAQIMAGVILQPGVRIGSDAIINTGAIIDHDCQIGDHVHVAPGVVLSGSVKVGDGTHLGTGARVIQGIIIGTNVIVGAGAVVTDNLPDDKTAMGFPARIVAP